MTVFFAPSLGIGPQFCNCAHVCMEGFSSRLWQGEGPFFTFFKSVLVQRILITACLAFVGTASTKIVAFINPFTVIACKTSSLKSAHIHTSKQYNWWSYNKSTFSTVHFDRNSFMCSCEGGKKALVVLNLALLLVVFWGTERWTQDF